MARPPDGRAWPLWDIRTYACTENSREPRKSNKDAYTYTAPYALTYAPGPAAAKPPDEGDTDAAVVGAGARWLQIVVAVLRPGRVPAAEAVADLRGRGCGVVVVVGGYQRWD